MYQAELRGKVPEGFRLSEDILTSNVFSFLKYSDRETYLRKFLKLLDLDIPSLEMKSAEFRFWPTFEDQTEPDVVLIAGDYYILFEAKLLSGFDPGDRLRRSQLERELIGGSFEAQALGKEFVPVAITAHSTYPKDTLHDLPSEYRGKIRWLNWQFISSILLNEIEEAGSRLRDYHFAKDLYDLLDKKNLRGYLGFQRLRHRFPYELRGHVFFAFETARFRGDFIGFANALAGIHFTKSPSKRLFFRRRYFSGLSFASLPYRFERPIFRGVT